MEDEIPGKYKNKVHKILARSYSVYLLFFLLGVYLNVAFNFRVFTNSIVVPIGFLFFNSRNYFNFLGSKNFTKFKKRNSNQRNFF